MEEYEETPDDEDEALEEDNADIGRRPSGFFGHQGAERYPADEEEAYLDDPDDGVDVCDDRRNQEEHRADRYDDASADSDDYTAEKVSLDDLKL